MNHSREYQRQLIRRAVADRIAAAARDPLTVMQALAAAVRLTCEPAPRRTLLCVTGEADIVDGIVRGTLLVGTGFLANHAFLQQHDWPAFVRYAEYLTVMHSGGLLPLVITGGTEAEALFAGMRMFGYQDDDGVALLAAKEYAEYVRALQTGVVRDFAGYCAAVEPVYHVDYWDFLTAEEVETVFARCRAQGEELLARVAGATGTPALSRR